MSIADRVGLLREHDFRQLFVAAAISQIGSRITVLALPLAAVLVLHASNLQISLLSACGTLAFLAVGLPAGAWVDRLSRHRTMIVSDLGRCIILGSVPLAWAFDLLSMLQLYVVALLAGVLTVFFDVASHSYLPQVVGRRSVVEANAKLEGVAGISQLAGPALAGVIVGMLTAPLAVAVDAGSFVASAAFLWCIRTREQALPRTSGGRVRHEVADGLRFVFGSRLLRAIALSSGLANLFNGIRGAMLVVLLAGQLRLPAGTIGLFFSVISVGAIAGALTATRIAGRIGQGRAIWVLIGATTPFYLLVPTVNPGFLLWVGAAGHLIAWFGASIYDITQISFRQRFTPERLLGRMTATMRFIVWGTLPLGATIGGVLGQVFGPRPTLWVAAVGGMTPFLPLFLSPLRTLRELPVPPAEK
jgi:MFS family permease